MLQSRVVLVVIAAFIASLGLTSCGTYSSSMTSKGAGAPTIAQLVPDSANAGSGAFTMTINGSGFGTDAVVFFNGNTLSTTYVTTNQLMVAVPAAAVANKAMIPVYVRTSAMNSNTVDFTVN